MWTPTPGPCVDLPRIAVASFAKRTAWGAIIMNVRAAGSTRAYRTARKAPRETWDSGAVQAVNGRTRKNPALADQAQATRTIKKSERRKGAGGGRSQQIQSELRVLTASGVPVRKDGDRFFVREFLAGEDPNTEHYRYRAYREYVASHSALSASMIEALYELGESDPDYCMGGAMMRHVLDLPGCPESVLDRALNSGRPHLVKAVRQWHGR